MKYQMLIFITRTNKFYLKQPFKQEGIRTQLYHGGCSFNSDTGVLQGAL